MSTEPCRFDDAITRAARARDWTAELRDHLQACPECRATVALVEQLGTLAAATAAAAPPPPSPHTLWLRAEYARRARVRARLDRLRTAAGLAAPLLAVVGFTAFRGAEGWARLVQAAALPSPQLAAVAVLGLAMTAWVMQVGRAN